MDSHAFRREIDKIAEIKGNLTSLNKALEDQTDRTVRHLYDTLAKFSQLESDAGTAGFMKKRKIISQMEKVQSNLEEDFMKAVRDFSDLLRKEHRDTRAVLPKLEAQKPNVAKAIDALTFPATGTGDAKDLESLRTFSKNFTKLCMDVHTDLAKEGKELLDENKRIVETYERHVTIDRGEVASTLSIDEVAPLSVGDIMSLMDKLRSERAYLDGRREEVSKMIVTSLVTEVESLQASVETASRLGLELPMDFSKQLRIIGRDASKTSNLTSLIALENQLHSSKVKVADLLRDRIINMKHEVTSKIVEGGIPVTADVIPEAPSVAVEADDVASLLSSYQEMTSWESQVKLSINDHVEDVLTEIEKATEVPDDTGITDVVKVRKWLADSKKEMKKAGIDNMVKTYVEASAMRDEYRKNLTDTIRTYITRFNELATSADRVLDYAQLSKKAPKVEDLEGGVVFLLQSLANLRTAVEDGVATFRDACQQEIEVIVQDLQTIKPAYAEIFMPIITELDEGAARIAKMEEFSEIRSEMKTIKETVLASAKDSLENLRYRLGVKIRLAAAKLMGAGVEIPGEVQEAISELNSVGVAADTVFSLPAIARKMIEIYEQKISAKVIESLTEEVSKLEDSFDQAKAIGVPVDEELALLQNLRDTPPDELEQAADSFDKLMNLTTSAAIHKKVRNRADEAHRQIRSAVSIFEDEGMSDFVSRLKGLLEQVPDQMAEDSKHVHEILEVCLTLANIQEEMLQMIKSIATKDAEQHLKSIREKSEYYSTIEAVYDKHPKDFSKLIFPLDKLKKLETELNDSKVLEEAIQNYNEVKGLRAEWTDKAQKMDDWHKSMRVFMTGFSPAASADQREAFITDAIKKVKETYTRDDISSYLTWAIREIADRMVGKRG
ncbi:MAG: hypothetical protein AM324_002765 [Candidatus Thorarchaeota archaeon SMTZ1-83]|nr:MAG: hypothetical protein AM324_03785 [Candidatus Thorarchaeota archaeon SMTZ1-83]